MQKKKERKEERKTVKKERNKKKTKKQSTRKKREERRERKGTAYARVGHAPEEKQGLRAVNAFIHHIDIDTYSKYKGRT